MEIPFEIIEQTVQCFGKCFYYKDNIEAFLIASGIKPVLARKYKHEYKFVWGKKLLMELNETENGRIEIRKILTAFYSLRGLPDSNVIDKDSGLSALRVLKESLRDHKFELAEQKTATISRKQMAEQKAKIIQDRASKLESLRNKFNSGVTSSDRQAAGFDLEDIIKDLFHLFEIDYKKSYKTETQQIDGHFKFQGFDYLVEAKWRKDPPTEKEIGSFKHSVETVLQSTRGVFISVVGFRDAVVNQFNGHNNIIMSSGLDLIDVFEGRIDLKDLLEIKIEKAAQYGIAYYSSFNCISDLSKRKN